MKRHIKKSFLWSLLTFELLILIFVFLLYILSDPQTLRYIVDRATSKSDITYSNISGNLLKTMTIYDIKYKGKLLATSAEIDWNMRALLKGDIEIETLIVNNMNVATIESFLQKNQTKSAKKEESSQLDFPKMSISHLELSILPYANDFLRVSSFDLELNDIVSAPDEISIKDFAIKSKNNHCNIKTEGEIRDKVLHLKMLDLEAIDIDKITKTLAQFHDNNNTTKRIYPIDGLKIEKLFVDTKPYTYAPYALDSFTLKSENLNASIKNMLFSSDSIMIESKTNLAKLSLEGELKNNLFEGKSILNLRENFFKKNVSFIDFESLNPINLTIHATPQNIESNITLKSSQIFAGAFKSYPTKINDLKSQLNFDINSSQLTLLTDANVSSKYASSLILKDRLRYDGKLHYGGTIEISQLQDFPPYSLGLFKNAIIKYHANSKDLTANLYTDKLHLLYEMYSYKRADFTLTSKELKITDYFPNIPKDLHPLKASLSAFMALDFNRTQVIEIDNNITSNALNIYGKSTIKKAKVHCQTKTKLTQNSFLKQIDKNIKFANIFPADLEIDYHDKNLSLNLIGKDKLLKNNFTYDINSSYLNNTIMIANDDAIVIKGDEKELTLKTHSYSLKTLQKDLSNLYQFKSYPYDGEVDINATISNLKTINAAITAPWLVYEYKPNSFAFAEKLNLNIKMAEGDILIKNYKFNTYLDYDRKFYATKPSKLTLQNKQLTLQNLWINDSLNTRGKYDIEKEVGNLHSLSKRYHYKGKEGDIVFATDITTKLSKNNIHLEGDIDISKGTISYEHQKNHEISDPDIIIIQEEQAALALANEKQNNLSMDISIHAASPLTYKIPNLDIELKPDIKVWKDKQKSLELLGRAIILHGVYKQGEKEFIIQPGEILFGGDILNPYLNIKAQHTNKPYIIDIVVTGTLDSPIVNFSSDPFLNQSDILSMLLFSTTTDSLFEGSANSSTQALSMLGNTFAKEIVNNFGLNLDKLTLLTNENGGLGIEIGKKISEKVTVIYTNDIVQSIKVRYQHSNNFETDLMISPESSGIDFLYKSEH